MSVISLIIERPTAVVSVARRIIDDDAADDRRAPSSDTQPTRTDDRAPSLRRELPRWEPTVITGIGICRCQR